MIDIKAVRLRLCTKVNKGCNCLVLFLLQCQNKGLLDGGKIELIKSCRRSSLELPIEGIPSTESFPVGSILNAVQTVNEVLRVISLPLTEHKDIVRQQLNQLINPPNPTELTKIIATLSGLDQLSSFVSQIIRINDSTKSPPKDNKEDVVSAESRAEIFNVSFVLLSYITTTHGTKILDSVDNQNAFFITWRRSCTVHIGQKNYPEWTLDVLLDELTTGTASVNASLAKWDEYCLCAGAVIKELVVALGCRVINADVIQKVCEIFKIKRPALCLCATVWLSTQFKTMMMKDRDLILKILRAFRGHGAQTTVRSELMAKIIEDFASPVGIDQSPSLKGKQSVSSKAIRIQDISEVMKTMTLSVGSPHITKKDLIKVKKHIDVLGARGFAEALVMAILNSGKFDEAKAYEDLGATLVLLDPFSVTVSLFEETIPNVLCKKSPYALLADPQGQILARFLGKTLSYALVLSKTADNPDIPKAPKTPKLQNTLDLQPENWNKICESLQTVLTHLANLCKDNEISAVSLFLHSLLEQLSICTAHLSPSVRVPDSLGIRLLKALKVIQSKPAREVLLFLCNIDTGSGRKQIAKTLCTQLLQQR